VIWDVHDGNATSGGCGLPTLFKRARDPSDCKTVSCRETKLCARTSSCLSKPDYRVRRSASFGGISRNEDSQPFDYRETVCIQDLRYSAGSIRTTDASTFCDESHARAALPLQHHPVRRQFHSLATSRLGILRTQMTPIITRTFSTA